MKHFNKTALIEATLAAILVATVAAIVVPTFEMIAAGALIGAGLVAVGTVEAKKRAY